MVISTPEKNRALWRAKFYQAVNIPLKIKGPKKASEKIANPAFDAASTYIKLLSFKSIEDVIERKRVVKDLDTSLENTQALLKQLNSNPDNLTAYRDTKSGKDISIHALKPANFARLMEAIIADYTARFSLDDDGAALLRASVAAEQTAAENRRWMISGGLIGISIKTSIRRAAELSGIEKPLQLMHEVVNAVKKVVSPDKKELNTDERQKYKQNEEALSRLTGLNVATYKRRRIWHEHASRKETF